MPRSRAQEGNENKTADCPQPCVRVGLGRLLFDLYNRLGTFDFEPPILWGVGAFGEMDLNNRLLSLFAIKLCEAFAKLICLDADDRVFAGVIVR